MFRQAGDFEVVNQNGRLQKNGGNVASYFCTPAGRVVHAVGQNVDAERLLKEAHWAVDAYRNANEQAPNNLAARARLIQAAHLAELNTDYSHYVQMVHKEYPRAREEFVKKQQQYAREWQEGRLDRRSYAELADPWTMARRRAAEHLSGDRAHQYLAAEPLAPFPKIRVRMFERLANERFAYLRGGVYSAAQRVKAARSAGLPILFIFYQGHGKYKNEYDGATKEFIKKLQMDRSILPIVRTYVVVTLPLREMAALSQLTDIPQYEFYRKTSPALVVANPDATQIASLDGSIAMPLLAARLWPPLVQARLEHTQTLAERGETVDALKLLRKIVKLPTGKEAQEKAQRRIHELNVRLAQKLIMEGSRSTPRRLLQRVEKSTDDADLRAQATKLLAGLD